MTPNSDLLEVIEDNVARTLEGIDADREKITTTVRAYAQIQETINSVEISEQDIFNITKRLETRFDIRMGAGTLLSAEGHTPWLEDTREKIDWYYWERYKRLLPDKKFNREVINVLDMDTNEIIDHLENPRKKGAWKRKGLCVGHVQSGKTANYLGVICKAADAGYKVIIVLAGLLNALRNQTQERIDEGFIGEDSSRMLDSIDKKGKLIGVGKYYDPATWRAPWPLTTSKKDFNKPFATQMRLPLKDLKEPVIFVIKKNVSTLKTLISWLKSNNFELNRFPMLLIDDEADHASVDTSKEDDDPTATNHRIRELLSLFEQSSYLGYTATPFANIFIDPKTDDEMLKDDLFPSDFIISLDTPSNYIGAKRIFENDGDLDIVREVDDYEDILPLKHKIDEFPATLPPSLYEAVRVFILIKAMRILRGQENNHNSMLVNVSRFTDIQSNIKWQIHEYLDELRQAIINHFALPEQDAMSNSNMLNLRKTWQKEFSGTEFSWRQVQETLKKAVSPIKVIEVNSKGNEPLDYNTHDYPNGRSVIAVGGHSLSRGLTLEGLTVSYFLRNSVMYDTLMQMGRWFGYRTGFEKLCRIYMTEEAVSWYAHISRVTEELRDEFKRMKQAKMTPRDFGLCVRSHPETLIVTARNKMRTAKPVSMQVNLYGRRVETAVLKISDHAIQNNLNTVNTLITNSAKEGIYEKFDNSHLFRQVPIKHIKLFLDLFVNHPASPNTSNAPLIHYLTLIHQEDDIANWDVVLIHKLRAESTIPEQLIAGYPVKAQLRKIIKIEDNGVAQENRRIGSDNDEQAGLEPEIFQQLLSTFGSKSKISAISCRKERRRPLLMLHLLDCQLDGESISETGIFAFGISFPGESTKRRPDRLVEYQVNTTWWKNNYQDSLDDESVL